MKHNPPRFEEDTATEFSVFSDKPDPRAPRPIKAAAALARKKDVGRKLVALKSQPDTLYDVSDGTPHAPLRSTRPQTKRANSPPPKPKEELAREMIARARGRRGSVLNETDAWKNIQMKHDERNADLFRQDKLMERCWQIWRQGYQWIAVRLYYPLPTHSTILTSSAESRQRPSKLQVLEIS